MLLSNQAAIVEWANVFPLVNVPRRLTHLRNLSAAEVLIDGEFVTGQVAVPRMIAPAARPRYILIDNG